MAATGAAELPSYHEAGEACYVPGVSPWRPSDAGSIGPAKTTTLSSVSPVFGLVMAVLFLKEKVSLRIVLGAALCVSGVWLVL